MITNNHSDFNFLIKCIGLFKQFTATLSNYDQVNRIDGFQIQPARKKQYMFCNKHYDQYTKMNNKTY